MAQMTALSIASLSQQLRKLLFDAEKPGLGNRRKRHVLRLDRKPLSDMKPRAKIVTKERELDLRALTSHIEATTRSTHLASLIGSGSSKLAFEFRRVL